MDGDALKGPHSYAVAAVKNGLQSHISEAARALDASDIIKLTAASMENTGGNLVDQHHCANWGRPRDTLTTPSFQVDTPGNYQIQSLFSNGSGPLNTGITCAIKRIDIVDTETDTLVTGGYLIMPQSGKWDRWDLSSVVTAQLEAGRSYHLHIYENEYSRNMSTLEKNTRYTNAVGGGDEAYNFVNIAEIQITPATVNGPSTQGSETVAQR